VLQAKNVKWCHLIWPTRYKPSTAALMPLMHVVYPFTSFTPNIQ